MTNENDLISRADAIEAVHGACVYFETCDLKDIGCLQIQELSTLPSAEAVSREEVTAIKNNYISEISELLNKIDALSAETVQLKQTDTLIIADALRYLAKDEERHLSDITRADALREQILKYGASMCHSAEAVQGWIPCSERLPEFPFISCDAHGNIHIPQGIFTFEDSRGIWCIDDVYDDKRTLHYGNRIVAWMPLPKPYKGGDSE